MNKDRIIKSMLLLIKSMILCYFVLQPLAAYANPGLVVSHNLVLPKHTETAEKLCPTIKQSKDSARSIIRLAQEILVDSTNISVIKIPNNSYEAVLSELQSKNAKPLSEATQRPASAKVVFQLKSESGERSQFLYLD